MRGGQRNANAKRKVVAKVLPWDGKKWKGLGCGRRSCKVVAESNEEVSGGSVDKDSLGAILWWMVKGGAWGEQRTASGIQVCSSELRKWYVRRQADTTERLTRILVKPREPRAGVSYLFWWTL